MCALASVRPLIPSGLLPGYLIPVEVAPLGWDLSVALGLGFGGRASQGHLGTRTHGRGYSWPARAPQPTCCSSIPCPRRGRGGSSWPAPFLDARHLPRTPAMPPQGFGASHFSLVALFPGHAHPWALCSTRGLRGPDCTLSHLTHRRLIGITDAWDDRPVTPSIVIPDLGAPTPQATCKPHAVGPGRPLGLLRGGTDGLIQCFAARCATSGGDNERVVCG